MIIGETIARYSRDLRAARQAQAENASRLSRLVSELEIRNLLNVVQDALSSLSATERAALVLYQPVL